MGSRDPRSPWFAIASGIVALCSAAAFMPVSRPAWSQPQTIKMVNPFPPGGTGDIITRIVTEQIGRARGVTFVIENRPGAGTVIGAEVVARAAADGSTLLVNTSALLISAHLRKLSFDPISSFAPLCNLVQSPQIVFVNSASQYATMRDFIEAARAKPGELTLSSTGPATASHVALERVRRAAKVSITYVPFPGNAPTVNAVLGNHVNAGIANYADLAGHIAAGKLRPLATLTSARIEPLPNLPTAGEAGYKEFEYSLWFGVIAPAKTPPMISSRLSEWFSASLGVPDVKDKFVGQGLYPINSCGADFADLIRKEYEDYGATIREANIKGE